MLGAFGEDDGERDAGRGRCRKYAGWALWEKGCRMGTVGKGLKGGDCRKGLKEWTVGKGCREGTVGKRMQGEHCGK